MTASAQGLRRVLVVGGGSGIGRAVAEAVLARGGDVAVAGRRAALLDALAGAHPGRAHALPCDVADPAQRGGLLSRARNALGGLDGLVYAAGVAVHEEPRRIGDDSLRAQLEVNLVAPLRLFEDGLELVDDGGAMVYLSSTLALRPVRTSAAYSASKAGMVAALRALALAGAARGLRVNAVAPGLVDTDMLAGRDGRALAALHPLGRLGAPHEIAAEVLHLLAAPWTTGAQIVVDGGLLLRE